MQKKPADRAAPPHPREELPDTELAQERALRIRAEEANRMMEEFLATLGHELRSPMNAIVGWAHLLKTSDLGATERLHAADVILRNSRLQSRVIEDMLDTARIVSGKLRLDLELVLVERMLKAAVEAVRPAAETKVVLLASTVQGDTGAVLGDEHRLQQVVGNLLSNAIKFTEPHGRIDVRAYAEREAIVIEVSDTGRGISPDFLPFLFERFRQGDASITRQHGGLGLGLAIVRHIVELHGGTVSAESDGEGKGAVFRVVLPRATDLRPTQGERPAAPAPDARPLAGARVLVIDDDPDARELMVKLLHQYGADATSVGSALDALSAVARLRPDVLVCDVGMPSEDGFAFIRKLRASGENAGGWVPAIALTGYAGPESAREALLSGFQMHKTKPLDPPQLVSAIIRLWRRGGRREG